MKKYLFIIALALSVLSLQSCQQTETDVERWGEISSYPDWWLNKYQPVTIERNLHIEFNKDAKEDFEREVVLALYRIDDLGSERPARPEDVQLFVNGEPSPDNTIHINKNDSDIRVGLQVNKEFLKENGTTTFNWKFKVADNGGLDYINDFEVSGSDETPLLRDNTSMDVYHKRVKNKPRVITDTSLLTILAAIIAIIVFIQLVTAKFTQHQLGKVFITVDGIRKNIMSMSREAKGTKQIILTGKKKSQGILSKLFQGKDCYLFIRGLESDIVLTPGKKFQSKARFSHQFYETEMAGNMNELKVIKGQTQDGSPIEVEFYAKNK
jgi:hypothetical protein